MLRVAFKGSSDLTFGKSHKNSPSSDDFLSDYGKEMKSECYIPTVVDDLIRKGQADCRILETTGSRFGVTYPDGKPHVVSAIQQLVNEGQYPSPLT